MRSGFNPNKDRQREEQGHFHQVVIPVYIPNSEGYFAQSLEILKLCVQSLVNTCHSQTFITIVNNGSHSKVVDYLDHLLKQGVIQELIHTPNIGKVNAILKGVNGHDFDLVTITDSDVLFKTNWQAQSYAIFGAFPKAAAVSPVPIPTFLKYYNAHLWVRYWSSKQLKFAAVQDPEALEAFQKSIENPNFYKPCHLNQYLTLNKGQVAACVGCGHFVNTYRGSIFNPPVGKHSNFALGGDSEIKFIDRPAFNAGGYRLATLKGYAYHMGNVLESWMEQQVENQKTRAFELENPIDSELLPASNLKNWWVKTIFKLLTRRPIWNWILQRKGLNAKNAKIY